ncbi:protein MCM10 homolog [Hylaeus anthracinus]|uniref:protein MCM10 homolog n=1 Tax=Hylaeus anthracinus TaxID=313031 RepID=UPI0023B9E386|nr:protein MCM10 homolog [Hylaeus anthracinus]
MDNDSDSDVGDVLNDLLANDDVEENHELPSKRTLKELDFNFLDDLPKVDDETEQVNDKNKSEVYDDNLDSSDDEDRRHLEEQKYTNYGRDIKSLLKKDGSKKTEYTSLPCERSTKTFDFSATTQTTNVNTINNSPVTSKDIYSDPFFGLRIVSPIVSSTELKARMNGKMAVPVSKIKYHINTEKLDNDWVIAGVLINKSPTRTSQKGKAYCIWKISDLSDNINTICLFMFSGAYKMFWKTTIGTIIGILNPNVLESKDNTDLATLSVSNAQKVMILGKSKDMGKCKSKKKNGEPCNAIINVSRCEFCIYHVQQEYKKCSQRSELQSFSNTQKFSIDMLKNKTQQRKPLNSNFPEFNAIVAVKNKQLEAKDAKRLALLSGSQKTENSTSAKLINSENCKTANSPEQQIKQNFKQISQSRGWKATVLSQSSSNEKDEPISSALLKSYACKQKNVVKKDLNILSSSLSNPRLGVGCIGGTIDLSTPITRRQVYSVKSNAIKWVQENGKIKPKDPNKIRLSKEEKIEKGKKRPRESDVCEEQVMKKLNTISDKFKEMLEAKSAHADLIEKSYEQEKEKYFNKLEITERMEQKMLNTYKVSCKAVRCLVCKYTSFSASDMCKEQKHPLRVTDATKRFFKCRDCGNRTVSLDRIPSHSCIKCSSSNWTRAAMMDERKTNINVIPLSIRGDEESHIGSIIKDASLNLLVPDTNNK